MYQSQVSTSSNWYFTSPQIISTKSIRISHSSHNWKVHSYKRFLNIKIFLSQTWKWAWYLFQSLQRKTALKFKYISETGCKDFKPKESCRMQNYSALATGRCFYLRLRMRPFETYTIAQWNAVNGLQINILIPCLSNNIMGKFLLHAWAIIWTIVNWLEQHTLLDFVEINPRLHHF